MELLGDGALDITVMNCYIFLHLFEIITHCCCCCCCRRRRRCCCHHYAISLSGHVLLDLHVNNWITLTRSVDIIRSGYLTSSSFNSITVVSFTLYVSWRDLVFFVLFLWIFILSLMFNVSVQCPWVALWLPCHHINWNSLSLLQLLPYLYNRSDSLTQATSYQTRIFGSCLVRIPDGKPTILNKTSSGFPTPVGTFYQSA